MASPILPSTIRTVTTISHEIPNTTEYRLVLPEGTTHSSLQNGAKIEVPVEGLFSETQGKGGGKPTKESVKVLLLKVNEEVKVLGVKCTHYGAPLVKGVVSQDGRITCPWHGACFNTSTGDIENAPALDHINSFPVHIKDGEIYIASTEDAIRIGRRKPEIECKPLDASGDVIIVGGGSGAIGAIEGLREKGYKGQITCITKEGYLPIDRTKLSKTLMTDLSKLLWREQEHFDAAGVKFHLGTTVLDVDFKNKKVTTSDGKSLTYSKIILASGGTPRKLQVEGLDGKLGNVFVLRGLDDSKAIMSAVGDSKGKKVVVIGSSFIGMEVGSCLAGKGADVTIVGMESVPMERVMGVRIGKIFQKLVASKGVKFEMSASVEKGIPSASGPSNIGGVTLKDGKILPADLVILGVGVQPETSYIKDESIKMKDKSLEVDDHFRVKNTPDAYAVGDIATYPYAGPGTDKTKGGSLVRIEHWNVAQNAARQVAAHIATGGKEDPTHFIPVFWSALGQQLRYCGNTMQGYDDVVVEGDPENAKFVAYYCKGEDVVAVASMQKDPYMTQAAELMRRGNMPSKSELNAAGGSVDILQREVPAGVVI